MAKILLVNYYGRSDSSPGGKRSLLWEKLLFEHSITFSSPIKFKKLSFFKKLIARFFNFLYGDYPITDKEWLVDVANDIQSNKYDYVILCCPDYSVCDLLKLETKSKFICDIRDGIYYESLWSKAERWRYKKRLLEFESLLGNSHILTTNIPGLKRHYESLTGKDIFLILNHSVFSKQYFVERKAASAKFQLLYTGGLMRSSIGQNLFLLCRAISSYNSNTEGKKISLTLVGRFNFLEKFVYNKFFDSVIIVNEIPLCELAAFSCNYDAFVISNTTKRDLLPSKFWFYVDSNLPILSIAPSFSLCSVSQSVSGLVQSDNEISSIGKALIKVVNTMDLSREHLHIEDQSNYLKTLIR